MDILVQRRGAFGDVLLVTPVVARLRREYPDAEIDILTYHPTAFQKNPDITHLGFRLGVRYDKIIDLDLVSERRPDLHAVDAYFLAAFGDRGDDADKSVKFTRETLPESLDGNWWEWSRTITVHPNVSWRNRTLSVPFWGEIVRALRALGEGYRVISLGTSIDHDLGPYGAIDTRGVLSTGQQAEAIARSAAFVCFSSGLLGLAGSTDTPIVSMDTVSAPEYSAQYRHGELGWNTTFLHTPLSCRGCLDRARRDSPVTFLECPLGTNACVDSFDAQAIAQKTVSAIRHDARRCL